MLAPFIVERNIIRVIGKRAQIGPGPEKDEIRKLWESGSDLLSRIPNRVDKACFGISIDFWHPDRRTESGEEGLRSYMIGAEVSSLVELPYDMESRIIPASRWVYVLFSRNDPEIKSFAPEEFQNDTGYLTGCVFGYLGNWIKANGYEEQDFLDQLEIYGSRDDCEWVVATAIK